MTTSEQQSLNALTELVRNLRSENAKFREDINTVVQNISIKTDKKHLPITLEQDILRSAQVAVNDSIVKAMTAYDSPVVKLVKSVIDENAGELRNLISDSFKSVIRTEDFKQSIVSGFSHKVARTIISNNDGLFDKVSNELKQDAVFKSRMALAVSNVVDECLNDRNK